MIAEIAFDLAVAFCVVNSTLFKKKSYMLNLNFTNIIYCARNKTKKNYMQLKFKKIWL